MIGNYTMLYRIKIACYIVGMVALMVTNTAAQQATKIKENIAVIARPSADSITLRWAPLAVEHWRTANVYGYSVERFTLVRNGKVIRPAERTVLTTGLKPFPEEQWEKFIGNKYGMITAQALYGETFELDIAHTDIMQIVNKAKENEQRYSIALFCADMSPVIAKAQGLYFTDKQIEKNVKYLYRISVITPTDTLRGSVFIDPQQKYILPAVAEVSGQATGSAVTLRWKQSDYSSVYTTYSVERSDDGKSFTQVSDVPGVTLSKKGQESKYQYAVDTLASIGKEYSYRIRGITPFGEYGPASSIVKVKGNKTVTSSVFITSALSTDNKSIYIQWEFPEAENDALAGFEVTRSATSSGPYKAITKSILPPSARYFKDTTPQQSNYYKLKAKTLDGTEVISMPYLAMLVDSIPPAIPTGLKGKVDEYGNVSISWKPNADADIYGYRIYRAYYQSEEFALMTGEPVKDTVFADRVQLQSLNEKIHYQVMAIDKNQNHSGLSAILSLALPDKVPPMSPVWRPVKSTKEGVILTWEAGGSQDVVKYELYRKGDQGQWMRLVTKVAGTDSIYTYTDQNLTSSDVQHYTVVAIDEANLESPPAPVVTGFMLPQPKPAIDIAPPTVNYEKKAIVLNWTYDQPNVASYRIYRKTNDGTLQLFRTIKDNQFIDSGVITGTKYSYSIVVLFSNGALSEMSREVRVNY